MLKKAAKDTDISDSNVLILGQHDILEKSAFDAFREGMDPEKWAFFAGVELPEGFPDNNYIRMLEMLTKAVSLWAGKPKPSDTPFIRIVQEGRTIFRFIIPEIEPMDYGLLKDIYSAQIKALIAA